METKKVKILRVDERKCTKCNMCNIVLPGFFKMYNGYLIVSHEQYNNKLMQERIRTMIGICIEQAFILEDKSLEGG